MQENIQSRKDILTLSPAERKRYFWCLKMLAILPAPSASSDWYFNSLAPQGVNKMQPKCIHDALIASHATCCEHFSFYFAHYHRHLVVFMEMWLNFAHEVLTQGPDKLKKISQSLYNDHQRMWTVVFWQYKELCKGLPPKVMAHYWNPTNYKDEKELCVPLEIADPAEFPHDLDVMDELFYEVRTHYPWDFNVKERWFNPENSFEVFRKNFVKKMSEGTQFNYFHQPFEYSPEEMLMLKGKITPRTNMSTFFRVYLNYISYNKLNDPPTSDMNPSCFKKTSSRNLQYFNKNQTNVHLSAIKDEQVKVNMGSFKKNMHHLSLQQMAKMSTADRIAAVNYNFMLPYYQLANSLYNQSYFSELTDFMSPKHDSGSGFQSFHNTIHNNFFFSMMDANLSITNLMFYPFHSWVDLAYEMKARTCLSQSVAVKRYLSQIKEYNNYFDYIIFRNRPPVRGEYPIMSWANPLIRDIVDQVNAQYAPSPAPLSALFQATASFDEKDIVSMFNAREYIMNGDQIRTSNNMNDLYQNTQLQKYKKDYQHFQTLKHYSFSYEYELYEMLGDGSVKIGQLAANGSNIPEYLSSLNGQVNHFRTKVIQTIRKLRQDLKESQHQKYYIKLLMSSITILGKYKSTIANGAHPIYAHLGGIADKLQKQFNEEQKKILHCGFIIHIFQILGKAAQAGKCLNCGEYKQFSFEAGFPKLWKQLHLCLLSDSPVIYSSKGQKPNNLSIHTLLSIPKRPYFQGFTVLVGAQQVCMQVIYKGAAEGTVRINVQSSSVSDRIVKSILSKQSYTLNCNFEFYKLHDVDRGKKQKYFEQYTYTKIIGMVTIEDQQLQFQYDITNFHSLIRYTLTIEPTLTGYDLIVTDSDYHFKKQFYSIIDLI